MAGQLADQWIEVAGGRSSSVIDLHRQAVDSYLRFVEKAETPDFNLSLKPEYVVETLVDWSKWLIAKYRESSVMPYRMASVVQAQLAGAVSDGVITDAVLSAVAQGPCLIAKPEEQPLDEFSEDELQQLVIAARAHVRALRKLRKWAEKAVAEYDAGLLTDAIHQRLGQMLKMAAQLELVAELEIVEPAILELFPAEAHQLFTLGPFGYSRRFAAVRWCYRSLFPMRADLIPFRVLLMAGTGASADEISSLTLSDVEWPDDGVRLQMTKARAGRSKGRFFPGSAQRNGWDVPSVVAALRSFGEPARTVSEDCRNQLWVSVTLGSYHGMYRVTPVDSNKDRLSRWIESVQGLHATGEISVPHDLRRIRKTKVTQRAIELRGVMADIAGDDHTTQVFFSSYGHTTTLKVYAAEVISRFQSTLAEAVKTGFHAFLDERARVDAGTLKAALPIDSTQASDIKSGALDMGLVDCQNPYASPFTTKGKLCASAPLSCLMCENAVVFTDHLPNIIALMKAMDAARTSMGPEEWIATWGAQYGAAQALIAALPASIRHTAEQGSSSVAVDLPAWAPRGTQ
ncbi:site-specific integrase [Mycobacterium gordonae]|uniref:site-specific integrase n=1 Tax=Mycobacterium gordonae TaxID=1778 RepID=UPI001E590DC1|nr:site-specific integrase [Mycobacterium gordonae]